MSGPSGGLGPVTRQRDVDRIVCGRPDLELVNPKTGARGRIDILCVEARTSGSGKRGSGGQLAESNEGGTQTFADACEAMDATDYGRRIRPGTGSAMVMIPPAATPRVSAMAVESTALGYFTDDTEQAVQAFLNRKL